MRPTREVVCAVLAFLFMNSGPEVNSQTGANLQGTWEAREGALTITLSLGAGGAGKLDGASIKYTVKDNILLVDDSGVINKYSYELNGNVLTLSGGDLQKPMVFQRQGSASATGLGGRRAQSQSEPAAPASPVGAWETQG